MGKTTVKEKQVTLVQAINSGKVGGILTIKCLISYIIMSELKYKAPQIN